MHPHLLIEAAVPNQAFNRKLYANVPWLSQGAVRRKLRLT